MSAIKPVEGVPGWRLPASAESNADPARSREMRDEARREWLERVQEVLGKAEAAVTNPERQDPAEVAEARERIAAVLAEVDALRMEGNAAIPVGAIPLSPTADIDAIAAAQMLAERIAADARHSLGAQARLGQDAVRTVIGKVSPAEKSSTRR